MAVRAAASILLIVGYSAPALCDEPCTYLDLHYPKDHLVAVIPAGPEPWQMPTSEPSEGDNVTLGFVFTGQPGELCLYDLEKDNIKIFPVPLKADHQVRVVPGPGRDWIYIGGAKTVEGTLFLLADRHLYGEQYVIFRRGLSDDGWSRGNGFDLPIPKEEYWRHYFPDSLPGGAIPGPPPPLPFGAVRMVRIENDVLIEVRGKYLFRIARGDSTLSRPEPLGDDLLGELPGSRFTHKEHMDLCVRDEAKMERLRWSGTFVGKDEKGYSYVRLYLGGGQKVCVLKYFNEHTPLTISSIPHHTADKQFGPLEIAPIVITNDGTVLTLTASSRDFRVHAVQIGQ